MKLAVSLNKTPLSWLDLLNLLRVYIYNMDNRSITIYTIFLAIAYADNCWHAGYCFKDATINPCVLLS
jgi:hypothetical protein